MKNKLPRKRKKACKKGTPEGGYAFMRMLNETFMREGKCPRFPKLVDDPSVEFGLTVKGHW